MGYRGGYAANISLITVILLGFFGSVVMAQDSGGGDCGLSLGPTEFQERVNEVFEERDIPQLFFTDNQLEAVQKSLDTYCCRGSLISADECSTKSLYPAGKNVVHSPYYLDHFLGVSRLYLRGENEICDTYGFDCHTRVDKKNAYPGKAVCFRYGEDADPRCQSLYEVGSGVDVMLSSTAISSPGNYRALYEKFWSDANNILIPTPDKAKDMDPKDLTMMHMGWYMCNEIDVIYTHVLQSNTTSDQSYNPIPGSTLQKCQTAVLLDYKSHALDYVQTISLAKGVDQMVQINTQSREHILDVLDDMKKTMTTLKSKMTNMLRRFPEFTNTCSV